jgi:nucleoside 2-deoxyribosyltransferase
MWFTDDMKEVYRKSISAALKGCGYDPLVISDKEYLNDITDEILSEIRQSKFVVADLTGSRGGVYFEAGFAYGLGKPVIWTCRKDWFQKENIHFDVEHFPFLIWEKESELMEKITNRVKAVF